MPYFKVDDHLHAHRKTLKAGVAAMGLWVMAGSWSFGERTDGWVPDYVAQRLTPDAEELAGALVRAGYWLEAEQDGERGWQFHQWDEWQHTADYLAERNRRAANRMRHKRAQEKAATGASDLQERDVRANTPRTSQEVPKRQPNPTQETGTRKRATQLPDDFQPSDANRRIADERGLDLAAVIEQWSDFHRAKGSVFKDWHAALNTWLRREQPPLPGTKRLDVPQSQRVTVNHCGDSTPGHGRHRWDQGVNLYLCPGA